MSDTQPQSKYVQVLCATVNAALSHLDISFEQITEWINNLDNVNSQKPMHKSELGQFFVILTRDAVFETGMYTLLESKIRNSLFERIVNTRDAVCVDGDMDGNHGKDHTAFYLLSQGVILVHDELGTALELHDVLRRKSRRTHATTFNTHIMYQGTALESALMMVSASQEETHLTVINNMTALNGIFEDDLKVFANHLSANHHCGNKA